MNTWRRPQLACRLCIPFVWRNFTSLALLLVAAGVLLALAGGCARSTDRPLYKRTQDVIYGRKDGMALTLDVFTPAQNANGAAVVWVVSGGWFSSHESISLEISRSLITTLVQRGYTVFAVVHSSQPRFTIPEMLPDIRRAVRYVRYHAADYRIDPAHIGITGASSGGHLALLQGVTGDAGDAEAADPVERVSSRVQAVACFFPPTDFLNYGQPGEEALGRGLLKNFSAPFAFHATDPEKRRQIGRQISPIYHVTPDDPPTLIIHGDRDALVPLQQSETLVARLRQAGVAARLVIKPGAGHGWPDLAQDMPRMADWFDEYLLKK
jgi:acetyl esterase/lipase